MRPLSIRWAKEDGRRPLSDSLLSTAPIRSPQALLLPLIFCSRLGVVNVVGSTISRESHCGIHVNAGPEIGVASTKAYTSQYIALVMMAIQLSEDRLSMTARRNSIIDGLHELPGQIRAILQHDSEFQAIAPMLAKQTSLLIMGRGYQHATCLEAALKIKELSYLHSE
ncbi:hypothetical protein NBRC10513_003059, partial [Rhodotorula toruloides]